MAKLTPKQEKFIHEYLVDQNATQAAIRAGYNKKTARQVGSENLSKPYIKKEIEKHSKKTLDKVDITVENVLQSIERTRQRLEDAMAVNDDMKATDLAALANATGKCNDQLGKYLKMYTDKVELEVTKMPQIELIRKK